MSVYSLEGMSVASWHCGHHTETENTTYWLYTIFSAVIPNGVEESKSDLQNSLPIPSLNTSKQSPLFDLSKHNTDAMVDLPRKSLEQA